MCGIAGFTTHRHQPEKPEMALAGMTKALSHRGPDAEGTYADPAVRLGHRRLSILDLAGGAQPMSSADGRWHIVFNGEIYNYVELRRDLEARGVVFQTQSDTEVLLQAWAEDGADCLPRLNGMFAFAIWDSREKRLTLARDPLGIKPLYYANHRGELLFASELRSLLRFPGFKPGLDPASINKYLAFGYIPAPSTAYAGVRKLEPGQMVVWSPAGRRTEYFWDLPIEDNPVGAGTFDESAEATRDLLREAVRYQLRSDVEVGILLSGGIDSSAVAALAAPLAGRKLHSFSIGFQEASYNELPYAEMVARKVGTEHHHQTLTPADVVGALPQIYRGLDEPLGDASLVPTWFLSRLAATKVKTVLGGDGGDELFAGYPSFQAHLLMERLSFLPVGVRDAINHLIQRMPVSHNYKSIPFLLAQFLKGLGLPAEIRFLLWMGACGNAERRDLLAPEVRNELHRHNAFEDVTRLAYRSGLSGGLERIFYLCTKLYLQECVLMKVDRASMAHSLEVRVPFLDIDLVTHAFSLRADYKLRGRQTKLILKEALKNDLPPAILQRKKAGFAMPVAAWLQQDLKSWAQDLTDTSLIQSTGVLDPVAVRRMTEEHLNRRADHRRSLWSVLAFLAWWREAKNV
ncbi:MAG: asparagine synthase (glutamine-hydrolyzing) [Verrucomicrobia bacterium]|nr:asparagine synthase (glutamine-hydrolyzing) [Verrucomicrobiota bacterium]